MGAFVCFVLAVFGFAMAETARNPRSLSVKPDAKVMSRTATVGALSRRAVGSTRMRVGAQTRSLQSRNAISGGGTRVLADSGRGGTEHVSISRSGVPQKANPRSVSRSATGSVAGMSRAAKTARATAVFNDLSKIGSGYAECRESYATCMDQMCANANDTYRRCFCSDRFTTFRNIEESLDEAMIMLQQFQDNNLEAVDKSAEEVEAMYSATIGEAAIKRDTSASAKLLEDITNLLSGGGKSNVPNSTGSLGILDLDFSTDFDDVWSDGGFSLFDNNDGQDLSTLEGTALFNAAQRQCSRLSQNMCENNAVFTMSRSSYNILITQDCNTYEKALNKKKETVAQAVRTAEKYLREARLEDYRTHNSADVNECLAKVRTAMLADTACGEKYKRCLDPTGKYINPATGNPIDDYRPWFFELENLITLGDMGTDVVTANPDFNNFLERYRTNKYVDPQLDTCRNIADIVWSEFKRTAIIEIAQAIANKVDEVKSSCVDTIAECYDAQSQSIINLGSKETAITAGALGRYVARDNCMDRVVACAALYRRGDKTCEFDPQGHFKGDANAAKQCGLESLINYVQVVDDLTVVEKCKAAVDNYLKELCTPDDGKHNYPYKCKGMHVEPENGNESDPMSLRYVINNFINDYCKDPTAQEGTQTRLESQLGTYVGSALSDIQEDIKYELADICEGLDGHWYNQSCDAEIGDTLGVFYDEVFGRGSANSASNEWGCCYENSARIACEDYNTGSEEEILTEWDKQHEQCLFKAAWYEMKCTQLGGYYENGACYILFGGDD